MTYATIAEITKSNSLFQRLTACAAEQRKQTPYSAWVSDHLWDIAATEGWADRWQAALDAGVIDPGADEAVITDADILAVVRDTV